MIRCLHCGAETSNGLALCELCRRFASSILTMLPIYFGNLARWRPGRAGSRQVPGSRVLYDGTLPRTGTGDKISDRLTETVGDFPASDEAAQLRAESETANALTTWARVLTDARPHLARLLDRLSVARAAERVDDAQAVAWLCRGFERWMTSIATLDWCGEFVRDLAHHEARLRVFTERYIPGWYAGGCRQVVGFDEAGAAVRCDTGTYVVPGLTWVTCGTCGATTYARDHLEVVLDEAREWVARPKALAEAVVALVDTEASVPRLRERIWKWEQREKLVGIQRTVRGYLWDEEVRRFVVAPEQVGAKRYRLGDVLDLVFADTTRRKRGSRDSVQVS